MTENRYIPDEAPSFCVTAPLTCEGCAYNDPEWGCRADTDECPGYVADGDYGDCYDEHH